MSLAQITYQVCNTLLVDNTSPGTNFRAEFLQSKWGTHKPKWRRWEDLVEFLSIGASLGVFFFGFPPVVEEISYLVLY